jgi:hypothetical protein
VVAPNPSSALSDRAPAAAELQPEAFETNEPPTFVEQPKPAELPLQAATRPLLGPATWVAGAALWSYVVAGQLVVRVGMPELLGIAFVLGVLVTTAYVACGRSLELLPVRGEDARRARFVKPTWVGVALAAALVFVAALVGAGVGDGAAMLFLLVASCAGVVLGKRFTGRPPERLRGSWRAVGVIAWVAAVTLSLGVLLLS